MSDIGATLERLMTTIEGRKGADAGDSYTASLLRKGPVRCAKKFGEEAVEAALAGALGQREDLVAETADVLYHLAVLLAANELDWSDISAALTKREGVSGHQEKAARSPD
ncbi:phosphoribosyl-ATP pyrophosphatase [Parvularcula bermudensis HTCC2503]|uniref:Phosphoribosyl-ATP pyrophosphatase n=1 Tax=Parvularcula bermudensis (strain ATCC BAA-594 / HTCC2503 / KCTC 12087) TaxID=314260 RepID=E0TGC7_PARBH|nr:phosphoribosyl-ATP diphosphatase [Parvularcula bermudensis]ADM09170.1 phosphoribosyl-ATP pyrophosphatase [Parvularcula bermudensis HTCC2503]